MMFSSAPDFWSIPNSFKARLLAPLGSIVSWITLRRMSQSGKRVGAAVICIGNPTVGGAGKTPTVVTFLEHLKRRQARPFALLRGHGGRLYGPVKVDLDKHDVRMVGDEALLLARVAPTIVSRNRLAGAQLAVSLGATHIIMDDGFQSPGLVKNATLLVVDGEAGIGNGLTIPAGPLRARFRDQLERADALLVVGDGQAERSLPTSRRKPILKAQMVPDDDAVQRLRGQRFIAFAGIGRPQKFFDTLQEHGIDVVQQFAFPDHHPYSVAEIFTMVERATFRQMKLVTTAKDYARLQRPAFAAFKDYIEVLPVRMKFDDPTEIDAIIKNAEVRSMLFNPPEPDPAAAVPPDAAAVPSAAPADPAPSGETPQDARTE